MPYRCIKEHEHMEHEHEHDYDFVGCKLCEDCHFIYYKEPEGFKAKEFLASNPPNTFNAIDVETANADRASICSIGIVHVRGGRIEDTWTCLIDPEDWFDPWNVDIHGITEDAVKGVPILPEVREELRSRLRGSILVSHTAFDRVAFERAMDKYGLEQLQVQWLDSARIVRRAWPEKYGSSGFGLSAVAYDLGIAFQHHDALEDAQAAAKIVLHACTDTGLDIEAWLERVEQSIDPSRRQPPKSVHRDANPDGQLFGEVVVFTGSLDLPRQKASDLAAQAGCTVIPGVTKYTTMLVVGIQEKRRLAGYEKSSKHRKVEALIARGIDIQILSEDDFLEVVK